MKDPPGIVMLHVVVPVTLLYGLRTIRGPGADESYDARARLGRWLLPGRLSNRDVWRRQQRAFATISMVFAVVAYLVIMVRWCASL